MSVSNIMKLVNKHKGLCHYCNGRTNRTEGSPMQATKEHVVPKSYGGANALENYVLACRTCNNKRGTTLFFCTCEFCATLINEALERQEFIDDIFSGIIKHNKPRVYRREGKWIVRFGHHFRHFPTWEDAMTFTNESEFCNGF